MQPKKQPWNNTTTKTAHKCIVTTLLRLTINSKSLKTHLESSYWILKTSKTTSFSSDSLTDVRPTSTRCIGPDFNTMKALTIHNTNLLFWRRFIHCAMMFPFHPSKFHRFQIGWWIIAYRKVRNHEHASISCYGFFLLCHTKHWFVHMIYLVHWMQQPTWCFRV